MKLASCIDKIVITYKHTPKTQHMFFHWAAAFNRYAKLWRHQATPKVESSGLKLINHVLLNTNVRYLHWELYGTYINICILFCVLQTRHVLKYYTALISDDSSSEVTYSYICSGFVDSWMQSKLAAEQLSTYQWISWLNPVNSYQNSNNFGFNQLEKLI